MVMVVLGCFAASRRPAESPEGDYPNVGIGKQSMEAVGQNLLHIYICRPKPGLFNPSLYFSTPELNN